MECNINDLDKFENPFHSCILKLSFKDKMVDVVFLLAAYKFLVVVFLKFCLFFVRCLLK